jgi:hypothetical protein
LQQHLSQAQELQKTVASEADSNTRHR